MTKYTRKNYSQKKYEKDLQSIEAIGNILLSLSSWQYREEKIKILGDEGHRGLRVGSNTDETPFLPLSKCDSARINKVLIGRYSSALNRIEKFGNPVLRNKPENNKLEQKIEATEQLLFDFR